ncbi:hypothetical protein ACQR18_03650 [Bradyrhizobium oligotrophicum]
MGFWKTKVEVFGVSIGDLGGHYFPHCTCGGDAGASSGAVFIA